MIADIGISKMVLGIKQTITYWVTDPRNEPCYLVNPCLWNEFIKLKGNRDINPELHTEADCVQWIDLNTQKGNGACIDLKFRLTC